MRAAVQDCFGFVGLIQARATGGSLMEIANLAERGVEQVREVASDGIITDEEAEGLAESFREIRVRAV